MASISSYDEVLKFLFSQLPMFQRQGRSAFKKELTNIIALCEALGNPEKSFPSIHIAGTNGKGSTAHILSALLSTAHPKVGIYTSPHFKDYRERIKIGNQFISEEDVIDFVQSHKDLILRIQPSFFEITVAMAFWYFEKENVDIAVIETGLGGRLDSTNVITPELSIITNIDFDHTEFLGETLQEIALEKAGIIKAGIPVVIGKHQVETQLIFSQKANDLKSPIHYAQDIVQLVRKSQKTEMVEYSFIFEGITYSFFTELTAEVQRQNLTTAISSFFIYQKNRGEEVLTPDALESALKNVQSRFKMMGRWQVLSREPYVIADGAHNEVGIQLLLKELKKLQFSQLYVVFGVVEDKDLDRTLTHLPKEAFYISCAAKIPRAKNVTELTKAMKKADLEVLQAASVWDALQHAKALSNPDDLILITGSMFVVAEIL